MNALVKSRGPVRGTVTRLITALSDELAKEDKDPDIIQGKLNRLQEVHHELREWDDKVKAQLIDDNVDEAGVDLERIAIEEYEDKVAFISSKVNRVLNPPMQRPTSPSGSIVSSTSYGTAAGATKKTQSFKLPKIELKKFSGDPREWLSFWALFQKIHEDEDINAADKFQYLVQSMVKGSRAEAVVESFPKTPANYEKAVNALEERFGRKELLIEVYTRDLIQIIMGSEKMKLSSFYDKLETHMRALESLGLSSAKCINCRALLCPFIESCLPEETLLAWQRSPGNIGNLLSQDVNKVENLMAFIRAEVQTQEKLKLARSGFSQIKAGPSKRREDIPTAAGLFSGDNDRVKCVFCDKAHESKDCFSAPKLTLEEKRAKLGAGKCCYLCFRKGHGAKQCKSAIRCGYCQKKHQIVMCPELPHHRPERKEEQQTQAMSNQTCSKEVLMQTLVVKIIGPTKTKVCRALIDNGSQRSYLLRSTADDLGFEVKDSFSVGHALFGGVQRTQQHRMFKAIVSDPEDKFRCSFDVLDQESICGNIPKIPKGSWLKELKKKGVWVSDCGDNIEEIELLIGADVYGKMMTGKIVEFDHGLTAVETKLGWTLLGKVPRENVYSNSAMLVTSMMVREFDLSDLWSLDLIGIKDPIETKSKEQREQEAKDHFLNTVTINNEGRYEVSLPWVNEQQNIPSNKDIAFKRLQNATRKLDLMGKKSSYEEVFDEWLKEGIIEKVPVSEMDRPCHYLPHRPVFKESSSTTKVRPVFDASCKSKGFPSLNDCLEKGPNLMELIPSILLRFRMNEIGVISDIRKAFLQISVSASDRDFLRFLWWENGQCVTYRHRRVVFGVNCSPFLLAAVLEFHLARANADLVECGQKLKDSMYVDNCVASFHTQAEVDLFKQQSVELMESAAMDLRCWEQTGLIEDGKVVTDVLGMKWDKELDTLSCHIDLDRLKVEVVTKRKILSLSHQIYDPLGFIAPAVLAPKFLVQEAWSLKLGWDEEVPEEAAHKFKAWLAEMAALNDMRIPRFLGCATRNRPAHQLGVRIGSTSEWEGRSLHTFVDASKDAYAAAVFLRTSHEDSEDAIVCLLQAKSRVAPVKRPTIPRMELIAAVVGSRLATSVKQSLKMEGIDEYYWSDSSTVIAWIQGNNEWGTFVGNRVKEIRKLTDQDLWRHVPGVVNPADLPSRGCSAAKLRELKWWEGPEWLKMDDSHWPSGSAEINWNDVHSERKRTVATMVSAEKDPWYVTRFNSYQKNLEVIGWVLRYVKKLRRNSTEGGPILSVMELEQAELVLLRCVQEEAFEKNAAVIKGLQVKKHDDGLLRVDTKISLRDDSFGFRYPIILPRQHPVVDMIIEKVHVENCHAGMNAMLSLLREKYWIVSSRSSIRKFIGSCVRCQRFQAKRAEAPIAPLPLDRIKDSKVFEVTGVDLCGPFYVKVLGEDEEHSLKKVWMVLFTCAVYRAVHLELVTSLSTERFLMALRRFIDRRGRPSIIYSDNGTNFVGAVTELKAVEWKKIEKFCTTKAIQWRFNPPTASWWGGWWERLIGLTKKLLLRVLGRATLDFEELLTIVCDIEAVVNCRPLTYVSEDPEDLVPLTPAMFLQEICSSDVPDLDQVDSKGFQRRFEYRQKVKNELRARFRSEYLSQLVQRVKQSKTPVELKVGDVVLIGADNKKRLDWPMGRIEELIPGKDKKVRVAKVKTASGFLVRPIQRLYPLEVGQEEVPKEVTQKKESVQEPFKPKEKQVEAEVKTRSGRCVKKPERYSNNDV